MPISDMLYDLPFVVRCIVFPAAVLLACGILRIIANNLPRQAPPVFEGIPFIGGLLKFVKVMPLRICATWALPWAVTTQENCACVMHQ